MTEDFLNRYYKNETRCHKSSYYAALSHAISSYMDDLEASDRFHLQSELLVYVKNAMTKYTENGAANERVILIEPDASYVLSSRIQKKIGESENAMPANNLLVAENAPSVSMSHTDENRNGYSENHSAMDVFSLLDSAVADEPDHGLAYYAQDEEEHDGVATEDDEEASELLEPEYEDEGAGGDDSSSIAALLSELMTERESGESEAVEAVTAVEPVAAETQPVNEGASNQEVADAETTRHRPKIRIRRAEDKTPPREKHKDDVDDVDDDDLAGLMVSKIAGVKGDDGV